MIRSAPPKSIGRPPRGAFATNESGSSAVEFAIVLPVFLTILLGIVAYGIYFGALSSTAQLAADAARSSIAGLTDQERIDIATASVFSNVSQYPLLSDSGISVDAGIVDGDPNEFRVAVRYDASDLPIWTFAPFLPLPSKEIRQVAVIRRGGY